MSLSKELSHDKAEWVKWPHLETHWQPQHFETPHRAINKADNSRSHSWWWDSHISPKSSKWLQENLAEMDSKVNAMLKIIEEDADSFAKRAEMYYKRRPELVILVEEFYRTYRALVERHTFLTKELRQNIAPALQAQLSASYATPPNIPSDLHGRPNSGGLDFASLSSYTFPGTLEFDEDSPIDFSAKKANNDEDVPSASSTVSFETRKFEFKPSSSSSEEDLPSPHHKDRELHMPVDATSSIELKKRIEILEDEKKVLMVKLGEDDVTITDLKSEVSDLLMKAKALEAEDKLAKDRLNSLIQLQQSLEAENLKLNHVLITCKEEKTQLSEARDHGLQEMLATGERIHELEQEVSLLECQMAASHAEMRTGQEKSKKLQVECEKLQQILSASQDENQRNVGSLKEAFESRLKELQKRVVAVEKENEGFKQQIATHTLKVQELQQQAMKVVHIKRQLEQELALCKESKDALELDKSTISSRILELQRELEATEGNKRQLIEQIVQRDGKVLVLEETVRDVQAHKAKLETDKDELRMQMLGLEVKFEELQKERDYYLADSQRFDLQCNGLEAAEAQLKEKLALLLVEINRLHEEKMVSESTLAQANSQMEELRLRLNAFSSDKSVLLQRASDHVNTNDHLFQESGMQTTHLGDLELILSKLILGKGMLEKQLADTLHLLSNLEKASKAESVKFQKIVDEHVARITELDSRLDTLTNEKDLLEKQGIEALESNSKLKLELCLLETERVERLLTDVEELKKSKDQALAKCKDFEVECLALKQGAERLMAQLELKLAEGVSLQNDKSVLEAELTQLRLKIESQVSAYSSEKASMRLELGEALEQVRITKISNTQLQAITEDYQAECRKIEHDLHSQLTRGVELEEVVSSLLYEKKALEQTQVEAQKTLLCLEEEKRQLTEEVKHGQALVDDLNGRMVKLESENKQLSLDLEQAGQQSVRLQEVIAGLSIKYTTQSVGLAKLEEQIALLKVEKGKALANSEGEVHDLEARVSELLAEITASNEQVSQMSEGIRSLEAELTDVHQQKEAFSEKLATSADHVMLLQKQLHNSREFGDEQQVELRQHAERIRALEMDVESMQTRADKCEKEMICEKQRSLDDIACLQTKIKELEEQVSHYMEVNLSLVKGFEEQKEKLQMQVQNSDDMSQNLEAELFKLHKAVSSVEESNSIPVHVQSRSLDANIFLPGRFEDFHQKIESLLEERKQLVKAVSSQKGEKDVLASRVESLEKDKDAVHVELMRSLEEGEQMITSLGVEVTKVKHLEEALKKTQQALDNSIAENVTVVGQLKSASEEGGSLRYGLKALQDELKKNQQDARDSEKELSQLRQAHAVVENELTIKISELSSAHEHAFKLLLSKGLLEEEAQQHLCQIKTLNEEVERLQHQLQDAELKIGRLEDELSKLAIECLDGKNAASEAEKEIGKQIATVNSLKEEKAVMCFRIHELEQDVSRVRDEKKILSDEMEALRLELKGAQGEREDLMLQIKHRESHLEEKELEHRALQEQLQAAERASVEAKEELVKHNADRDYSLNLEVSVMLSNLRKLEHDLTCCKDEKETLNSSLEDLQSEMTGVHGENEHLKAQLKAASMEVGGKETETRNMQEQLRAAESQNSSLAEALLSSKGAFGAHVEGLQVELSQFKATNIQVQKDLASQLECVSKLKDELSGLRDETFLLQEERDFGNKELADVRREAAGHLNELEVAIKRGNKKDAELLELSALSVSLKQSLASKEMENSNLLEDLRKSTESQNASKKRYVDEIGFLQSEELKWRTEASATSALMAEKVANLRMENAALHQDLSLKIELVLKQQKEVESLTEECKNLSQALQDMSAEMNDVRNDLQIFKDVVIPSMEERAVELQDKIEGLTFSNERHVTEIVTLRTQLKDAKGELLLLHEKNSILKMELIFNVEMMKHVDVVLKTAKAQSAALCDKLGSHCQMLEQKLTRVIDENGVLSKKLSSVTQEKNSSVAEVHHLLATVAEVEQMRRVLASAREGTPMVKETDPAGGGSHRNLDSLSNSDKGDMEAGEPIETQEHCDEATQNLTRGSQEPISAPVHEIQQACSGLKHEDIASSFETQQQRHSSILTLQHPSGVAESDGSKDSGTTAKDGIVHVSVSSSPLVIERLKEEIAFLQEKIQMLELAAAEQGARDFLPSACEILLGPRKNSTASSSSILTVDDTQDRLDEGQRFKEESRILIEEIESLKSQSLAAWTEHNLIENTVRDLQASKAVLQEKNGHLNSEVNSCKLDIVRLQEELILLQQKYAALLQDVEASMQEKRNFEEAVHMLEDVTGSLECSNRRLQIQNELAGEECSNRRLQIQNELAGEELKKLQGVLAKMHDEGMEVVAQLKVKMVTTFEEAKLMIDECRKEMGDEGLLRFMMGNRQECSEQVHERIGLVEPKQSMVTKSPNEKGLQETIPEPVATNRLFLTELQARAEEANMLAEVLLCIRKMLSMFFSSSEHTCQRGTPLSTIDAMSMKGEETGKVSEPMSPEEVVDLVGSAHQHIKLAERLRQAFVDEKLEHELLELKEGTKQLEEDLQLRLDEVQRMESELEKLEGLLEQEGRGEREGMVTQEEKKGKNKWAEENVKELREMLVQQRGLICRMKEEVMFGEAQQEAAAEDQVTVLVSMESAPSFDGWDDEQVSKELESLRSLNKRHSADLQTISQDLQSMGSIIKSAQDQLLQEPSEDGEEEIMSMADLRTQKSNIIDLRVQDSRVSTDSTQQLLSPSPHMVQGDFVSAHRMSSDGSIGQFPLKPRNFGFTWFMLLFSPDRKASSLVRGKSDKAVWATLRRSRRSSSGSGALMVERGRKKGAGCLACVSNTSRLDSFEHR